MPFSQATKVKIDELDCINIEGGEEGDNREWDGWMVSQTQGTWVWARLVRWWWTGKPGMLQSMELQRVGHDCVTEQQYWRLISIKRHSL